MVPGALARRVLILAGAGWALMVVAVWIGEGLKEAVVTGLSVAAVVAGMAAFILFLAASEDW